MKLVSELTTKREALDIRDALIAAGVAVKATQKHQTYTIPGRGVDVVTWYAVETR